jgi:hypothetical protein
VEPALAAGPDDESIPAESTAAEPTESAVAEPEAGDSGEPRLAPLPAQPALPASRVRLRLNVALLFGVVVVLGLLAWVLAAPNPGGRAEDVGQAPAVRGRFATMVLDGLRRKDVTAVPALPAESALAAAASSSRPDGGASASGADGVAPAPSVQPRQTDPTRPKAPVPPGGAARPWAAPSSTTAESARPAVTAAPAIPDNPYR